MKSNREEAKVINILEADTAKLFDMRQYMLGDQRGKYLVICGDLYLGLYKEEYRAEDHAESLNKGDKDDSSR